MPNVLELQLAGESMQVLADRALYWPARHRLLIADLHLGKGNILRSAGIAVPSGGTGHDLARLDVLLRSLGARELWILGDFLHGVRHPYVEQAWRDLLAAHPSVYVSVIKGNHDRHLVDEALGIRLLPEELIDGPFTFRHHPTSDKDACTSHVLCGHLHPVVRIPGLPGRYPAFLREFNQTVLPAFSTFTGGYSTQNLPAHWIACVGGELLAN